MSRVAAKVPAGQFVWNKRIVRWRQIFLRMEMPQKGNNVLMVNWSMFD